MILCEAIMGSLYMVKRIGPRTNPEGQLIVQEQKQNNKYVMRRTAYDQSDKAKAIDGQHQHIQSQYGDGVQG